VIRRFTIVLNLFIAATLALVVPAAAKNPHVTEIVVVFKTHFDIGYTDLAANVVKRYRTTFTDGALNLIDQSRGLPADQQFAWTVPGWPLEQMTGAGQSPDRRAKVLRALKEGRFAVHALPFSLQTESLDLEDLVRGMTFSADLARSVGIDIPRAAKMTDVPCHTWVVPTLLKHAGVQFLHIGCNGGSHVVKVPPLFWWEGPDGSRVLTEFSPQYGTGLIPPDNWPYHTWLAMIMTGDNQGPPSPAQVNEIRGRAAREMPSVKLKFGKLEDFFDAIAAEHSQHIPAVRGDMPDTWIHGFESMPIETKTACNVRPLETALGVLDTQLRMAGVSTPPLRPKLAAAYENSLLYSEHTFGFYGSQPGGFWYGDEWKRRRAEGKYARFEKSFNDKRAYIHKTEQIVGKELKERMELLAKDVEVDGPRVVVFNSLPWRRSGEVEVSAPGGQWEAVRDVQTGGQAPLLESDGSKLRFNAADVPPCGRKSYKLLSAVITKTPKPVPAGELENQYLRLVVDPKLGGIISLTDKRTGRDLISVRDEKDAGQYLHERFSTTNVQAFMQAYARMRGGWAANDFGKPGMPGPDKSPYTRITLTNWQMIAQPDGESIILRSADAAPLAKRASISYTLRDKRPYLDIEWTVEDKTPNPIPEGGWLRLPFAIDRPQFKLGRLGSIIDPASDIIAGGNRRLICLNSGMTVTGPDGNGVGLCPIDSPLVSLGEPGLWKYSDDYVPTKADVFVNLYNNMWNTNFPLWQEGSWTSRVRLWAVHHGEDRNDIEQDIITPSWEARTPLIAAFADGPSGTLSATDFGLELSRRGVLVTAFGPDPYSAGTLLRVWEQAGTSGELTVTLPGIAKYATATPVNLRGERMGVPLSIEGQKLVFRLPAFAPASYVLQ
jgi:alpha-mannosidase